MPIRLQRRGDVFLVDCMLEGSNVTRLVGIIDSGSSVTYVTSKVCDLAKLKHKGTRRKVMCVHGKDHRHVGIRYRRGLITLGTKSGSGIVYELDVRPVVDGLRADVIIGRDLLRHFKVTLNWRDGEGLLEE